MPDGYPTTPGHAELKAYFQSYARHFGVDRVLELGTEVKSAGPHRRGVDGDAGRRATRGVRRAPGGLRATTGTRGCRAIPGTFTGELLHSHAYKTAEPFAGKRVLVIGAAETRRATSRWRAHAVSARTEISMRRGYWFDSQVPDGLADRRHQRPADAQASQGHPPADGETPHRLARVREETRSTGCPSRSTALRGPSHHQLRAAVFIRHGRIHPRPDIARFEGEDGPLRRRELGRVRRDHRRDRVRDALSPSSTPGRSATTRGERFRCTSRSSTRDSRTSSSSGSSSRRGASGRCPTGRGGWWPGAARRRGSGRRTSRRRSGGSWSIRTSPSPTRLRHDGRGGLPRLPETAGDRGRGSAGAF
jgi:hypothetical protein